MEDPLVNIINLLKKSEHSKVVDKLYADGVKVDQLLNNKGLVTTIISSDLISFIIKATTKSPKMKLLRHLIDNKTIFKNVVEKGLVMDALDYVTKYGSDKDVEIILPKSFIEYFATFPSQGLRNQVFKKILELGRQWIVDPQEPKQRVGFNVLDAVAIATKDVSFLQEIGRELPVVQACWKFVKEDVDDKFLEHIMELLLETHYLGDDVGANIMSVDFGPFLLQEIFSKSESEPIISGHEHGLIRELLATVLFSSYYPFFREKNLDFFKQFYEKATPLLKHENVEVRTKVADLLQMVATPLPNKKDTLDTSIFTELTQWVFSDDPELYYAAIFYLSRVTKLTEEAQLAVLKQHDVVNRFIEQLFLVKHKNMVDKDLILLSNLAQHPDAKEFLPVDKIEKKLANFFENDTTNDKSVAFRIMSCLFDPDLIVATKLDHLTVINDIKKIAALLDENAAYKHHYLVELVFPLANFSVNDHNKEILGEAGAVEPLLKVVSITSPAHSRVAVELPKSRKEACTILWNMAFKDSNKERIKKAKGVEILTAVARDSKNEAELIEKAKGVLWMLGIKVDMEIPIPDVIEPTTQSQPTPHIMISYNWGVQSIVLKLAASLKEAGYKVWLDVEQMAGSTLGAMAEAIEGSAVVLICMSEKYKDSPNCRLEGEYCQQQKKSFIPLLMQENYKPTGWLGILLGARLWHSFTDESGWDKKVEGLVKEIGSRGKKYVKLFAGPYKTAIS